MKDDTPLHQSEFDPKVMLGFREQFEQNNTGLKRRQTLVKLPPLEVDSKNNSSSKKASASKL